MALQQTSLIRLLKAFCKILTGFVNFFQVFKNQFYPSYFDRLSKLDINSIEQRRLEFNLITFSKLVKSETTISIQSIFEPYITNYLLRGNIKKLICKHNFYNKA